MTDDNYPVQKKIHQFCVQLFIERTPQPLIDYLSDDIFYFCNKIDNEIQGKTEVHKYFVELCQVLKIYNKTEFVRFRVSKAENTFYNAHFTICYDDEINLNCTVLFKNLENSISIKELHIYWNVLLSHQDKNYCMVPQVPDSLTSSSLYCGSFTILANDNLTLYSCEKKLLSLLGYENFSELKQHTPFFYQLLHPTYKKNTISEITNFKQYNKDFYTELCLLQKNGHGLWLLSITQKKKVNNHELISFFCFNFEYQKNNVLHDRNILNCINGGYGIYVINENERIFPIFFSDRLFALLEKNPKHYSYPAPRVLSTSIFPEDREFYIGSLQNTAKDHTKSVDISFRIITPKGHIKWLKTSSFVIPTDEHGSMYYLYVLFTDITEVKKQHNVLLESLEKTKTAHLLCSQDENWSVVFANEQSFSLLGISKNQLLHQYHGYFSELFAADHRQNYLTEAKNQLEKTGFFDFTAELIVNNKVIQLQLVGEKIFSEENNFVLSLYNANSEQTKLYNLIELKNEINTLYQNIPAIIFHCAPDGSLTFANDYFFDFATYSKDELSILHQNRLKKICTPKSYRNAVKILIKNIRTKSTKCFFEITFVNKQGKHEILLINATLQYSEQGKFEKLCCIASEKSLSESFQQQHFIEKIKLETVYQKLGSAYWEYDIQTEECHFHAKINNQLKHFHFKNFVEDVLAQNILTEESKNTFIAMHSNLKKGIACEKTEIGFYDENKNEIWHEVTYIIPKNEVGYASVCYGIAKDITELKQKRLLLDYVSNHININFWTYNAATKTLKCLNHSAHNFNYSATEYNVPESRIEKGLVHPEDCEIYRNTYDSLSGSKPSSCEIRIKNKNGEFTWVKITLSSISNNASNPVYIGTAFDISEQKQIEIHYNQLINSKTFQFRNNIIAKIMYNLSQNKVISLINSLDSVNNQKLPSAADFINEQIQYIVPGYYREQYIENFNISNFLQKYKNGERQFQYIFPIERENVLSWISNNITLFQNPEDDNIFAAVNCYDISEEISRKVFSENYLNKQLDFLIQIDTITDNYKFFSASSSLDEYSNFNLIGKFSVDFGNILKHIIVGGEENENIFEEVRNGKIFNRIKDTGKYDVIVKTYRGNRSGKLRYKQFHFYQYSFIPYIVCFACSDITEHYRKEEQKNEMLKQALHAATVANQTKNSFLASMSHDLRTPMNAIIGMTKLALEEENNSPKTTEYLNIINDSSKHLLAIINDILEMNKLESGEIEFHKEQFSITEELAKVIDLFKTSFAEKNLCFSFDDSKVIHSLIEGDKTKLNRIVTNLLSNAQKYTPVSGKISMTVSEQHQQNKNISLYTIAISDTGIGISQENLHTIFDPFKREDDGKVQKIEGIGLGLSIVKMLVEKQGGSISVTSQKNKGSTFTVAIPYGTIKKIIAAETPAAPVNYMQKDLSNLSILIAEDNAINILVLQKLLEKLKVKITVAHNGQEAFDIFSENQDFDIILMDIQMPILNGNEATRKIRRLPYEKAKTIPIIAVTANAFNDDIKECLEAGMNEHISKPIKFDELYQFLVHYSPK